jgi:imidazolonepropionase
MCDSARCRAANERVGRIGAPVADREFEPSYTRERSMLRWDRALVGVHLLTATENGRPYGLVEDGAIGMAGGSIAWLGSRSEFERLGVQTEVLDGEGRFVSPGLIDCHTHAVYGGNRAAEWERRLAGESYESIARGGGGIAATVAATCAADEDGLYAAARGRLERLLREGVTAVEIKSGYGLDLETELKQLRVATDLGRSMPLDVSRTLLAAHAIPRGFAGRGDAYVEWVRGELLPAARPLCEAVDAFCEPIAFSWPQCAAIFAEAARLGLGLKIHAEQLSHTGAAAAAAALGAWSADHLEYLLADEAAILARHGTVAVLLPGAYYFLRQDRAPPIAALRGHGVEMAIATDTNPGSSPVGSLLLMLNMACSLFGLTPEEAFRGVTRSAARALRLEHRLGTLEVGKQADLVVWEIGSPAELAYGIAQNPCRQVYKRGELVIDRS